jgi:hypothetical protein
MVNAHVIACMDMFLHPRSQSPEFERMRIGKTLVLLAVLAVCPSVASAEPVTMLFDVTVTERARFGGGPAESIDPIFFSFGMHFDNTLTGGLFGTPSFDLIPLVADGPNLAEPLNNAWVIEERTPTQRSVSIGGNRQIPFSQSFLRMERTVTGPLTPAELGAPPFTALVATLMSGPLAFNYESFLAFETPDGSLEFSANSFSYFGTATLQSLSVPEPSTVLLLSVGAGTLLFLRRRRPTRGASDL